jgi:PASTA domain
MGRLRTVLAGAVFAFAAVPATASATCSNLNRLNKVKSYSGTVSTSYVTGTLTGPPPPATMPNTATISIDRSASNLQISDLKGPSFSSSSQPTGGSVSVNDNYTDQTGSVHMTGSGPTVAGGDGTSADISPNPNCTYQVDVGFDIPTTSVITGVEETDTGVADDATSAEVPIPSNLVLKGSTTIPASAGGGVSASQGLFDMSGDPVWGASIEYVTTGKPEGTAKISWDLNPAGAPSQAGCVVPKVTGLTENAAAKKIKKAGCKVGKVTKKHSSKVRKSKVISSKPKAGKKEPAGTKVGLVVSSGK